MTDPESQPIDLERTFGLMDVADELRRQRRRVEEHLETSDRERIKAHLIERYRAMGHDEDPALIDEAIDRVLAQSYRFRPPEPGLGLRLGRAWARRRMIARRLALPVIALVAFGGLSATIVSSLNSLWYGRAERQAEQALESQASDLQALTDLRASAARVVAAAESLAAEPAARARAQELGARAERQAEDAARGPLQETVGELEVLLATLEQEYTLRIVEGVERDGTRHYLVVQAVGADGRLVPQRIRNEEDGRTRTVEEWGERVTREVYDAVGRDYEDDGLIDDDEFGQKQRGFLEPERRFENLGQITDW